ncbi:MAG: hypothetical protein ACI3W8_08215 [Oscillospiraceae bacterium]
MDIEKARNFIYRNARPLDLARWRYLFEGGSREDVLQCLAAYQNEDGGFGHGLEPDCWNPHSSPIQTWAATEILREAGLQDAEHPLIRGILRYLASGDAFDGHAWANTVPSNDEYPHAPWWDYAPAQERSYNPTASLAGFILRYAEPGSALYATAARLANEAYAFFKANCPLDSMHTAACFVSLYEYLVECGGSGEIDIREFEELLQGQLRHLLTQDASSWATEYVCKPSLFIHSKNSAFYAENKAVCDLECAFIARTQEADGSWNVTWDWGAYPEQWHVSKNWWKSDLIIKNVKYYSAMQ